MLVIEYYTRCDLRVPLNQEEGGKGEGRRTETLRCGRLQGSLRSSQMGTHAARSIADAPIQGSIRGWFHARRRFRGAGAGRATALGHEPRCDRHEREILEQAANWRSSEGFRGGRRP